MQAQANRASTGRAAIQPDIGEKFRGAMRRLAATVTIISTGEGDQRHGMTATAVASLSVDPPSILVCVNRQAGMHPYMIENEKFCVNVLHRDQAEAAIAFAGKLDRESRFGVGNWVSDDHGTPYLLDAQANLFCRKVNAIPYASHTIFLAEVCDVRMLDCVAPLVYSNGDYMEAVHRHTA